MPMKSATFRDVTPCSAVEVHRRLGGTYYRHIQGRRVGYTIDRQNELSACCNVSTVSTLSRMAESRSGFLWTQQCVSIITQHNIHRNYQLCDCQHLRKCFTATAKQKKLTPWSESASKLYRPSYRLLSAKLMPNLWIDGAAWSAWRIPYGRILGFLDRSRYFSFQAAPQLYSRGWVDTVTDPLLLRKSGSAGNRTRTSGSAARNSDH
jgi:hypothetical protein